MTASDRLNKWCGEKGYHLSRKVRLCESDVAPQLLSEHVLREAMVVALEEAAKCTHLSNDELEAAMRISQVIASLKEAK